jgi:hypothetical protein
MQLCFAGRREIVRLKSGVANSAHEVASLQYTYTPLRFAPLVLLCLAFQRRATYYLCRYNDPHRYPMDPLSLTASIAGLLGLSGQILTTLNSLYTFGKSAKNAVESICRLKEEVEEMNGIFCHVQLFILGTGKKQPSHNRLMMISIHHLVATLSGCVLVYSSLDKYLNEVAGITDGNAKAITTGVKLVWERVRWAAWKESDVASVLEDLQRHKMSLSLMLAIIQW